MLLANKVAIVTGASRGLGKAIALALAEEGADVVVAARTVTEGGPLPGTINQTAAEIEALGRHSLAVRTSVSSEQEVEQMVAETIDRFGRVDILVNNAGIGFYGTLPQYTVKRWDLVLSVNLRGTFLCTKAVLPSMMELGSGSIINLSSVLARSLRSGLGGSIAYGVSKAAIERFTRGLAVELRPHNIAVNALCPSYTDTDGLRFLNPDGGRRKRTTMGAPPASTWQSPGMWGRYAALVATQDARSLSGKILTEARLRKLFGVVDGSRIIK